MGFLTSRKRSKLSGNDQHSFASTTRRVFGGSRDRRFLQSCPSSDHLLGDNLETRTAGKEAIPLPPPLHRQKKGIDSLADNTTNSVPPFSESFAVESLVSQKQGQVQITRDTSAAQPTCLSVSFSFDQSCMQLDIPSAQATAQSRVEATIPKAVDNNEEFEEINRRVNISVAESESTVSESLPFDWDEFSLKTGRATSEPLLWFPTAAILRFTTGDVNDTGRESRELPSCENPQPFIAAPQRMVRESCLRHVKLHCEGFDESKSTSLKRDNDVRSVELSYLQSFKDTRSAILRDDSKADKVARECLRLGNYEAAVVIGKDLLKAFEEKGSSPAYMTSLASQLALLSLITERSADAVHYSAMAVDRLPLVRNPTKRQAETAVHILLVHGLVQWGTLKVDQALSAWREAIHIAIPINGFRDVTVAVLLNNMGIIHMYSGDLSDSLRSFEQSIDIQRSLLCSGCETRSEMAANVSINRLANTMNNVALVWERLEKYDRAISLLDESIALYESTLDDTGDEVSNLQFLVLRLVTARNEKLDETALNSSDEYSFQQTTSHHPKNSIAMISVRVSGDDWFGKPVEGNESSDDESSSDSCSMGMSLFGNRDGIPSRRAPCKASFEQSDFDDFLVLGSLSPELTPKQRVRETVLNWFGRRVESDPVHIVDVKVEAFLKVDSESDFLNDPSPNHDLISTGDLDAEELMDADLHLYEIHKQATAHLDQNEINEALALLRSTLNGHRSKYGRIHHLVGSAIHNIGMALAFAQRYSEALVELENALLVRDEALGFDHPDVQSTLMKIALMHLANGDLQQAHNTFVEVHKKLAHVLDSGHPLISLLLNNVGVIAYELGDTTNALESFHLAFSFQKRLLDSRFFEEKLEDASANELLSVVAADTLSNIAFVHAKTGQLEKALETYESSYSMMSAFLPCDHHRSIDLTRNIDSLLSKTQFLITDTSFDSGTMNSNGCFFCSHL